MKKIILSMLLVFLSVILTGCKESEIQSDFNINQNNYMDDFRALTNDELVEKYDNKIVEFTGIVWKLSSSDIFEGVNLYGAVSCKMEIDEIDENVLEHMLITVVGTAEVQSSTILQLSDCTVTKVHSSIDHKLDAIDFNAVDLANKEFDVFEVTGEITGITSNFVLLKVDSSENDLTSVAVAFIDDFELTSYSVGDQVVILAIWDGELFNGYEIY